MSQHHSLAHVSVSFLSEVDDLLTSLLLDVVIFGQDPIDGRKCGKMNATSRAKRLSQLDIDTAKEVTDAVRVGTMTTQEATDKLCSLNTIKHFVKKWDDEMLLFQTHLKRYLLALRPESAIAFHETDRYTRPPKAAHLPLDSPHRMSAERAAKFIDVAVFSTRKLKKGEVIDLRGGFAHLTEEEDDKLRNSGEKMDFSVFWSDRHDCFSLLLGPARFVNHDCRNNVEFQFSGASMKFKVIEDIEADEEIFTNYGAHYFDQNNAACLCSTCELFKHGAFAPAQMLPKKIATGPTRRSTRVVIGGPDIKGPPTLAQKGRSDSATSASSASSVFSRRSNSTRMSTPSSVAERRRSDRVTTPIDELRSKPRVPHVKLAPPPGYMTHYRWDGRKKIAKYTGPHVSDCIARKRAEANLGKRKREDDDDAANSSFRRRGRRESSSAFASEDEQQRRHSFRSRVQKLRKIVSLGTRTSKRASTSAISTSATAREIAFKRLEQTMGAASDSELSDVPSAYDARSVASSRRSVRHSDSDLTDLDDLGASDSDASVASARSSSILGDIGTSLKSLGSNLVAMVASTLSPARGDSAPPALDPHPPDKDVFVDVAMAYESDDQDTLQATPSRLRSGRQLSSNPGSAQSTPKMDRKRHRAERRKSHQKQKQKQQSHFREPSRRGESALDWRSVSAVTEQERSGRRSPMNVNDEDDEGQSALRRPRVARRRTSSTPRLLDVDGDAADDENEMVDSAGQASGNGTQTNGGEDPTSASTMSSVNPLTGTSASTAPSQGGGADDDGDEERNRRPKDTSSNDAPCQAAGDAADHATSSEQPLAAAADMVKMESVLSDGLSGRDEQDKEAAQLLMTFMLGPSTASPSVEPQEQPAASGSASTTARTTKKPQKEKRSKPSAPPMRPSLSANPRSTRRNSQLEVEKPAPAPSPPAAAPVTAVTKRGRSSSNASSVAKQKSSVPSTTSANKRQRSETAKTPEAAPTPLSASASPQPRGTRSSAPIAKKLQHLISSDANAFVTGAYDPETGKYYSAAKMRKLAQSRPPRPTTPEDEQQPEVATAARASSSSLSSVSSPASAPAPASAPVSSAQKSKGENRDRGKAKATKREPSPPSSSSSSSDSEEEEDSRPPYELALDGMRTTRRSAPLPVDVRRLLDSPAVASAVGGYDKSLGRYVTPGSSSKGTGPSRK